MVGVSKYSARQEGPVFGSILRFVGRTTLAGVALPSLAWSPDGRAPVDWVPTAALHRLEYGQLCASRWRQAELAGLGRPSGPRL